MNKMSNIIEDWVLFSVFYLLFSVLYDELFTVKP